MSCLGYFFPKYAKRRVVMIQPDTAKVNPLLNPSLPTDLKELEKMEIDIADRMCKANRRANHATKKMTELLETGAIAQANHHLRIKISAAKEVQTLSNQLMEVVQWRNEILESEDRE